MPNQARTMHAKKLSKNWTVRAETGFVEFIMNRLLNGASDTV
jgi:hypothetical protein